MVEKATSGPARDGFRTILIRLILTTSIVYWMGLALLHSLPTCTLQNLVSITEEIVFEFATWVEKATRRSG